MVTTDLEAVPSHIETPDSIELKASAVASGCIGAWSVWPIGKDTVFGPYIGDIKQGKDLEDINYRYAWEVFDLETFNLLHVIDATDPSKGNWMRYVNCARYFEEQNIVSVQQEDQVYYKAIKNIEPGEELLTWFEPRKKKRGRKRRMEKEAEEEKGNATATDPSAAGHDKDDSLGKRKRKPKVFPDSYQEIQLPRQKKLNKIQSSDSSQSETSSNTVVKEKRKKVKETSELKESKDDTESESSSRHSAIVPERKDIFNNDSVSWLYPEPGEEYMFELKKHHVVKVEGKRAYKCDICSGLYRHIFSLKRHYLKNHINYRYLGRTDVTNCLINLAQVLEAEKAAVIRKEFEELGGGKENSSSNDVASDSGVGSSVNCVSSKGDNSTDYKSSNDDPQLETKGTISAIEDDAKSYFLETGVENLDDDIRSSVGDGISVKSEVTQNSSAVKDDSCQEIGVSDSKDSEIVHRPGLYRCYLCFQLFETVAEIREHTVNHPKSKNHMPFACNKCEMRFSYIQNLVRHQAVHQANGNELINQVKKSPGKGAKKIKGTKRKDKLVEENTDIGKQEETNQEKKKSKFGPKEHIGKDLVGKLSKSPKKKYHCSRCSMKFGYLQNLVRHQQVHKDEKKTSAHSCEYCGKGFPSLSNMKKHVRFHLGYRISCRYCGDIHQNVGGLRKHIRIAHPEVHKAKLKNKLAKDGVLRKPDKKDADKKSKASKIKDGVKDPTENMDADKQKNLETKKKKDSSDELFSDNEISFAAEEIDDGGSRFKFACTICKRRFSSYINMCRHRRKSHDNESRHRLEASNSVKADLPVITETPEMVALFYANVASNVAINMTNYIDGGQNSLQNCTDHIRIADYDELPTEQEKSANLPWDRYNFPFDYKPTQTMSYMEIKNKFKIRSEFEIQPEIGVAIIANNDISNGCDRETNLNKVLLSDDDGKIEQVFIEKKPSDSGASCKSQMLEMKESVKYNIHCQELSDFKALCNDVKMGSLEQTFKPETKRSFSESASCNSKENIENKDTVEKTSVEYLSVLNMADRPEKESEIPKHISLVNQAKKSFMKLASFPGKSHSASSLYSGFELVMDGKYKNFENDILPSSFNTPLKKPSKDRPWLGEGPGTNGSLENDNNVNDVSCDSTSPGECTDMGIDIFNQLQLVVSQQKVGESTNTGDNYDDAKLSGSDENLNHSPLYNFENIAFGKHGNITCVCGVCRKQFHDLDCLVRHHLKKHPSIAFNFLEVEQGNGIDLLHYSEPSNVGVLAVTSTGLESAIERDIYHCTGCGSVFKNVSRLHVHIVNCVTTSDPSNNSDPHKNKKKKTSLRSKIKKKLREIINGSQNFRFRLKDFAGYKAEIFNMDGKQRKRIFTGCRKRKVVSLPDSPIKLTYKRHHDIGYNPNNHIRRRELTELLDTHQCNGCGVKFKTISLLERHVKKCAKKEKFKELHPLKSVILDESLARLKHACFYCSKNFTYPKSLINHFQEFCPIKKMKIDKDLLTENEKEKEQEMVHALRLQEEEKLKKMEVTENHTLKKRLGWPKGLKRKNKRKGHAWTAIKRRKSANDGDKSDMIDSGTVSDEAKMTEPEGKESQSKGTGIDYTDFTIKDISSVERNDLPKEKDSVDGNGTAVEDIKKEITVSCDKNETLKKDAIKSSLTLSEKPKQNQDRTTLSQGQEKFSEKGKLSGKSVGSKETKSKLIEKKMKKSQSQNLHLKCEKKTESLSSKVASDRDCSLSVGGAMANLPTNKGKHKSKPFVLNCLRVPQ